MMLEIRQKPHTIYNHPHPKWVDMLNPIHRGIKIANIKHFSRKDNQSTRENIAKFTNQYDDGVVNPLMKLSLFGL